jgi:hypothetical protein
MKRQQSKNKKITTDLYPDNMAAPMKFKTVL